jgi:hypothetical protein
MVGCGAPSPDRVSLALAPDVISSDSGVLSAQARVWNGDTELKGWNVKLHVDYTDRNDVAHAVDDMAATSDGIGAVQNSFAGLKWEGAGTVTASVFDEKGMPALDAQKAPIMTAATFAVIDQSPPAVSIVSPANGAKITQGTKLVVQASASDEIGVSQLYVQAVTTNGSTNIDRTRSTILASGTTSGTASFEFDTGNDNAWTAVTIYAMAADMSGNLAVASSINNTIN